MMKASLFWLYHGRKQGKRFKHTDGLRFAFPIFKEGFVVNAIPPSDMRSDFIGVKADYGIAPYKASMKIRTQRKRWRKYPSSARLTSLRTDLDYPK